MVFHNVSVVLNGALRGIGENRITLISSLVMGGVDIVVTHAPPAGLGDDEDPAHWGFQALVDLLDKYQPPILVHGHVHTSYNHQLPREIIYKDTRILNACERYVFEVPDRPVKTRDLYQVIYKTRRKAPSDSDLILR